MMDVDLQRAMIFQQAGTDVRNCVSKPSLYFWGTKQLIYCYPSTFGRFNMPLGDKLRPFIPSLRRYSRALMGNQNQGDTLVFTVLEAILEAPEEFQSSIGPRIALYQYFHRIWQSSLVPNDWDQRGDVRIEYGMTRSFSELSPLGRQIFLLNALEGFTVSETSLITRCPENQVESLLRETVNDIDRETKTSILIIEDEPFIAMELERIVEDLGHKVAAIVTRHEDAVAAFRTYNAGLILADVQLADYSSGIDAVQDILEIAPVPVIFITAFPEKLLTGSRMEPSFLISKPFHVAAVRAAISQSLLFNQELSG